MKSSFCLTNHIKKIALFFIVTYSGLISCTSRKADLIIYNATIYTLNDSFEQAKTLVVQNGKFIDVGGDSLRQNYQAKDEIDANGAYIYPGFIDAHCHFTGYAKDKYKLALFGTQSFGQIIQKIQEYAKQNKREWIEGRGWDQNDWSIKDFPTKDSLDKLFPNTPIFLLRIDGHAALCNQKALDIAGVNQNTQVKGGEIELKNGKPSGILIDNAIELVRKFLPPRTENEIINDFIDAQKDCVALGLTSVVDCGIDLKTFEYLKKAYQQNKLQIKTTVLLSNEKENFEKYLHKKPYQDNQLHIAGYKIYADGALGSRGALLLKPYSDKHQHYGFAIISTDSLQKIAQAVIETPYQLCTHAIGDSANREVLKIYAQALQNKNDKRWRIEHAQVIDSNDFHYFGDYNIVPSVQPTHATSDMYWAENRIGKDRIQFAYAYQQLLKENQWLPLGTDFPVEELNPIYTFYAAVFRFDKQHYPEQGFQINNALTRKQALQGMTIWAAKSVFEEKIKGSIEKNKAADFCILPIDLMAASPDEIYQTKITATYINGHKMNSK